MSTDGAISFPDSSFLRVVRYSRVDGEALVQDFWHLYNALNGIQDDAVFNDNIPEEKKSEGKEMDDKFETDSEEEDQQ